MNRAPAARADLQRLLVGRMKKRKKHIAKPATAKQVYKTLRITKKQRAEATIMIFVCKSCEDEGLPSRDIREDSYGDPYCGNCGFEYSIEFRVESKKRGKKR